MSYKDESLERANQACARKCGFWKEAHPPHATLRREEFGAMVHVFYVPGVSVLRPRGQEVSLGLPTEE